MAEISSIFFSLFIYSIISFSFVISKFWKINLGFSYFIFISLKLNFLSSFNIISSFNFFGNSFSFSLSKIIEWILYSKFFSVWFIISLVSIGYSVFSEENSFIFDEKLLLKQEIKNIFIILFIFLLLFDSSLIICWLLDILFISLESSIFCL